MKLADFGEDASVCPVYVVYTTLNEHQIELPDFLQNSSSHSTLIHDM